MIRIMRCLKKREDISHQEFRDFWDGEEYRSILDNLLKDSNAKSISMNLVLQISANNDFQENLGSQEPCDAVMEIFWNNAVEAVALSSGDGKIKTKQMNDFESKFIDFSKSSIFVTEVNK